MYYQSYEDYMRQVLGYPSSEPTIYETHSYKNEDTYVNKQLRYSLTETEIKKLYPESYNLIYPLVCRICDTIKEPISSDNIEQITDEIYKIVEKNQNIVNVKIGIEGRETATKKPTNLENNKLSARQEMKRNLAQANSKQSINRENSSKIISTENTFNRHSISTKSQESSLNKITNNEIGQQRNPLLRDLIKILILQRIFGTNIYNPPRPNMPRPIYTPVRPPFPANDMPVGINRTDINYTNYL